MASEAAVQPTTKRAAHPYHMYDAIVEQPERVAQVLATQRELIESAADAAARKRLRSEEHTSELQSRGHLVCRLLLEKKKNPSLFHDYLHPILMPSVSSSPYPGC